MQLSRPVPFPSAGEPPSSPQLPFLPGSRPVEGETPSFEAMLVEPKEPGVPLPSVTAESSDSEQAALLVAATFYQPPAPQLPPPTGSLELASEDPATSEGPAAASFPAVAQAAPETARPRPQGKSMFFTASSVRAYASGRSEAKNVPSVDSNEKPLFAPGIPTANPTLPQPSLQATVMATAPTVSTGVTVLRAAGDLSAASLATVNSVAIPVTNSTADLAPNLKYNARHSINPEAAPRSSVAVDLLASQPNETQTADLVATLADSNRSLFNSLISGGSTARALRPNAISPEQTLAPESTATGQTEMSQPAMTARSVAFMTDRQTATLLPTAGMPLTEKIAAAPTPLPTTSVIQEIRPEKHFLSPQGHIDAGTSSSVGIDVAKEITAMSSLATNRPKPAVTISGKSTGLPTDLPPAAVATTALPLEKTLPLASVRETMAAVLSAVEALERRADTAQSAVNMNFQVGSEKLALHLELRAGIVHTTFRTDSTELRTALGQEWQATVPGMMTREGSVAAPIFVSSTTTSPESAQGSLGQGHPQQRNQEAPESRPAFSSRPSVTVSSSPAAAAPIAAVPAVSTSLLNAFA